VWKFPLLMASLPSEHRTETKVILLNFSLMALVLMKQTTVTAQQGLKAGLL
jgi:hypothetical protein